MAGGGGVLMAAVSTMGLGRLMGVMMRTTGDAVVGSGAGAR